MQLNTLNTNYTPNVITKSNVRIESPRDIYSFLNRLINDRNFYMDFQENPIKVFEEYHFDTSKILIPENFILPTQQELRERLSYINNYEDFVSPSQIQSLPVLPAIFVFIPIFAY